MSKSNRPKPIKSFNRLNLAATVVGVLNIVVHYGTLRNSAISKGAAAAGPFLGIILLILSYLVFWFFIYRRGSNIGKWVFVFVTAVSVAMLPLNLGGVIAVGEVYAVIDGIAFVLQIAAAAMLFQIDAKNWLGTFQKSA